MSARKTKSPPTLDFEKSLLELEHLVTEMERGELTLEESLKQFERGITLTRTCQEALTEAQQKVEILTKTNGQTRLQAFNNSGDISASD